MEHFFEKLERDIDFQGEYEKLEKMFCCEYHGSFSIEGWIEINFRKWKKRGNYISLREVRHQLNMPYERGSYGYKFRTDINIHDFLIYCEMLYNLCYDFDSIINNKEYKSGVEDLMDTVLYDLEKMGVEAKFIDNHIIIVEKNAVAITAAEIVPNLSETIIEYNHFLLKGNIDRKKELLKTISDAIEPKREELKSYNKTATEDFFFLVNNLNIRHNNCDPTDLAKYCKSFDIMSLPEKEKWYDKIYDQALMLFVLLDYQNRKNEISNLKKLINNKPV